MNSIVEINEFSAESMESLRTEIQLKNEIIKQKDAEIELLKEQFTALISNIQKSLGKVTLFNTMETAMEKPKRKPNKKAETKVEANAIVPLVEPTDTAIETQEIAAPVESKPVEEKPKKKYNKKSKNETIPATLVENVTDAVVQPVAEEKPKRKYTKKPKSTENADNTSVANTEETPVEEKPKTKNTKKAKIVENADTTSVANTEEKSAEEKPKRKYTKKPKSDIQVEVIKPVEVVEIPVVEKQEIVEELTNDSYEENEEENGEEISAYDFEIDGIQYLIDEKNTVYDKDSYAILGVYNEETGKIE
jgi:hypothetical protein